MLRLRLLAFWAEEGRAAGKDLALDSLSADWAGLSITSIDLQSDAEFSFAAVQGVEVANRGAAGCDGFSQHRFDGCRQVATGGSSECAGRLQRRQASPEQRFAGIDIANANDVLLGHDEIFDWRSAIAGGGIESGRGEVLGERFRAEVGKLRRDGLVQVLPTDEDSAKAAWV